MPTKIVVLDSHPLDVGDLDWTPLTALGELALYAATDPGDVGERIADATVVLTNKVRLTAAALDAHPTVRLVSVLATGYDVVDLAAANRSGVTVCNVPAYSTKSVAQHTIALMLELARAPGAHAADTRNGGWKRANAFSYWLTPQVELSGKLVVVGSGAIGRRVGSTAEALGLQVAYAALPGRANGTPGPREPWPHCLTDADIVSLHVPLVDETRSLVDGATLALMRPGVWLINTARGGLVDEEAVAAALHSGHLGGYATDVLSVEPAPEDHPLLDAPRCLITPHIGWSTQAARKRLLAISAANVRGYLAGRPQNVVSAGPR